MFEFANEALSDFSRGPERDKMKGALTHVRGQLGKYYGLIIGGQHVTTEAKIVSHDPSELKQIVGYVAKADQHQAEAAMQAALHAFDTWKRTSADVRARYFFKAAAAMRRRKHEFSAWMCYEAGKTWAEADADVAEAIDFMEFYAREMMRLSDRQPLVRITGEDNELQYIPLGVGVIIPPWNFPLAILVGMTSAALVAGNTVIVKPASATPVIAAKFFELLEEVGLPAGVANFLPGSGGEIGDYLVKHPKTRFINFTGSREVGLRISRLAAEVHPGQIWIKRVVAEMGGKDAIVVDNNVDVNEAAITIVNSAFGFGGQKCSACSRAVIHADMYDQVAARVAELTAALQVGRAYEEGVHLGPVVDQGAYDKILEYIEIGKMEGKLLCGGGKAPGNGHFITPTVFGDVKTEARIAQEEIFGPVLALTRAHSFEEAIAFANGTEYGLTGAVFSHNREHLEYARSEFHVGNLYFNRKCTGALVGVHPFGGFNMSGTDSKAGGRDYLMLFMQAKIISEKL
ncbi:MAG: L-glutamate gamma-semialdehyde dehydrogenase [Bacilli bacterium]